jgi:alkylation response protein AidB-like acyl-CoA dehydrogenase
VDLELNEEQQAVLDAVGALLEKHAGPARAIELGARDGYDCELEAALLDAGFAEVVDAEGAGPLEAALVTEAVAEAGGVISFGASALVARALRTGGVVGPVAITEVDPTGPVRFAAHARSLLVLDHDGDEARVVPLGPGACEPVRSSFGYPMGRCPDGLASAGEALGAGSADGLARWWRLALAVEATGTMAACLDVTTKYLCERRQFGHAIGSFQAVQHRLAELAIHVEASRWLTREAAFQAAPAEGVAAAASYVLAAAGQVFSETHQLSGAIGFTREHDLHVFSMRLQALRIELGGVASHRRALAEIRWGAA